MNNLNLNTTTSISKLSKTFEIDFDDKGYIRTLSNKSTQQQLFGEQSSNNNKTNKKKAAQIARRFFKSNNISKILNPENFTMELSEIKVFAFGYRVSFQQIAQYKKQSMPVQGGAVHITINKKGEIFSLSSTIQHGKITPLCKEAISERKAIILALAKCKKVVTSADAKLIIALHKGEIQPVYEVRLGGKFPYRSHTYSVLANTGEIVEEYSKQICCFRRKKNAGVTANALLITPDPELPVIYQTSSIKLDCLPNNQVLKNANFEMFTGEFAEIVLAKKDGSYCYSPDDPEFAAVSTFLTLHKQIELYFNLGLNHPKQPMFVVVEDSEVKDNAYFDPQRYEIHIGVGSGVENGGLTKNIAFDLSVSNHEFGHAAVYLQAPGGDLDGELGEAINEAIGDVLGALAMDYLSRIWYANKIGVPFSANDLVKDDRVIGKYALPPFGIRCQKNKKRIPGDLVGECHADGLIIGGALADLLEAIAINGKNLEGQIKYFVKLTLMALALMPGYKVNFHDMLRALVTADKQLSCGKYRAIIEKCFEIHGITLGASTRSISSLPSTRRTLAG